MKFLHAKAFFICLAAIHLLSQQVCRVSAEVRKPAVAGLFYPAEPDVLKKQVDLFLEKAEPKTFCASDTSIAGIVVPHAGYQFSGETAASAFKSLHGRTFDRFIFLGVDHRTRFPSVSLWAEGSFETPLGNVPVDKELTDRILGASDIFIANPAQHEQEHSIEVLLPFFIETFGLKPSVFITLGGPPENGSLLGEKLLEIIDSLKPSERVLLIASTDWSHYHDSSTAKTLDERGIELTLAMDQEALKAEMISGGTELCGINAVLALITVMKACSARAVLLDRSDSSRGSGDSSRVVGYASILFEAGRRAISEKIQSGPHSDRNMNEEKPMDFGAEALAAVRKTLEAVLARKSRPAVVFTDPRFQENRGLFVTLKKRGELRGCIGLVEAIRPLKQGIQDMAVAAALEDPRFPPVTLEELSDISIEVSILSEMIPVNDIEEIQVGRDGLLLRKYPNSGLLLPQVATEWGWDRETFLNQLCLKAGLMPGSHKASDAKLYRFTAEIFSEKKDE